MDKKYMKIVAAEGENAVETAVKWALADEKIIIVMPNDACSARINRIRETGAQLVLSPGDQGLEGACALAEEMKKSQ